MISFTLARWVDGLVSILLPPACQVCGRRGDDWLCGTCSAAVALMPSQACPRCDHPRQPGRLDAVCPDCGRRTPAFAQARAVGPYDGVLREAVRRLKYRGAWRLADPLAAFMAARARHVWGAGAFDAVVPVPLDPERESARGYNQAALLSSRLAVRLHLCHQPHWLRRHTPGQRMSRLGERSRRTQGGGVFVLAEGLRLGGARILLVDDVMTTGTTVEANASLLAAAGARVCCLVVARGVVRGGTRSRQVHDEMASRPDLYSSQSA